VGVPHRLPAETVLPSPDEEVQPATGAAETVLLCSVDRTGLIWSHFLVLVRTQAAGVCLLGLRGNRPVKHYNNPAFRS